MEEFRPENSVPGGQEWKLRLEEIEKLWERRKPANTKHRRRHHAPTRRSGRRGEILKKCEEILENLRSQVSDLIEKSEVEKENGEMGSETLAVVEPMKSGEGDGRRDERFYNFSDGRGVGGGRDEVGGDLEPPQDQVVIETQKEVGGTLAAVALGLSHDLVEELSSLAEGKKKSMSDGTLEEVEMNDSDRKLPLEEPVSEGSPPSATALDCGATMAEVVRSHDLMKVMSSSVIEVRDWELGIMNFNFNILGQAQNFIITPSPITKSGEVLQAVKERDKDIKTKAVWKLRGVGLTFIYVGVREVGVGRSYGSGLMQLTNIPIMVKLPLVHEWDPGGPKVDGWDPSGFKRDEDISAHTSARECQRIKTYQCYQVLFLNLQAIINLVGECGGASMSSKMPKSPIMKAAQFSNEERLLQEARRGIENKKHHPSTLVLGAFRKILRYKGTSMLPQFIHVHHLIAKEAWVTGIDVLDTHYGGQTVPTPDQLFNIVLPFHKPLGLSIENRKQSCFTLSFLIDDTAIWRYDNSNDPSKILALLAHVISMGGGAHVMALVNSSADEVTTLLDSVQDNEKLVGSQEWIHICVGVQSKSKVPKEAIDFLYEQLQKSISDSSKIGENIMELLQRYEEHLPQRSEASRRLRAERYSKQWDPGANHYASYTTQPLNFKLWDPGGRPLSLLLSQYFHLEDKVNLEGGGVDAYKVNEGYIGNIQKVNERNKWKPISWDHWHT